MELFLVGELVLDAHVLVAQYPVVLAHPIKLLLQLNDKVVFLRYRTECLLEFTMMVMELLCDLVLVVVLLGLWVSDLVLG